MFVCDVCVCAPSPFHLGRLVHYQWSNHYLVQPLPGTTTTSASGPPGDDRYGQLNSSFLYQQANRDSVPHLVTSGSGAVYVVTSSEHSCPSKTHPRLSERDSRPPISSQPADTEWSLHPEIVSRIFGVWGTPAVDMFATVSNSRLPQFMSPIPEP